MCVCVCEEDEMGAQCWMKLIKSWKREGGGDERREEMDGLEQKEQTKVEETPAVREKQRLMFWPYFS